MTIRLYHIKESIAGARIALDGKDFDEAVADLLRWAAFERFLEIISEASRHIPSELKDSIGRDVPWRNVAGIGNVLRHVYSELDRQLLWQVYQDDFAPLEHAVDAMLTRTAPLGKMAPTRPPRRSP